mgnify:CR=1 FL=1
MTFVSPFSPSDKTTGRLIAVAVLYFLARTL